MSEKPECSYAVEFDNYPKQVGHVEIIDGEDGNECKVWISNGSKREVLLDAYRDQWGVFLEIGGVATAQEDGTRSAIDAVIQCLLEISRRYERETLPATVTENDTP